MGSVYAWMAAGIAVAASVASYIGSEPELMAMLFQPAMLFATFVVPFMLIGFLAKRVEKMSPWAGGFWYFMITGIIGTWLSGIGYMAMDDPAFAQTVGTSLLITTGMFGSLSIFGWVTRKDLTGMGNFLFAALIGLILALIVNIFWHNEQFHFYIAIIGVLIFSGLIAFDTQNIKHTYLTSGGGHGLAIMCALTLFLNFLNMFQFLLILFGMDSSDD